MSERASQCGTDNDFVFKREEEDILKKDCSKVFNK